MEYKLTNDEVAQIEAKGGDIAEAQKAKRKAWLEANPQKDKMEYSWQFDPLEPDKPAELTCDGVVIATTTLNNAKELANKLNGQADLCEALKRATVYLNPDSFGEASTLDLANKAITRAEEK